MDEVKKILVVSRSTKHCQKAVHHGILLARILEAKLYVIHTIHDPFGLEGWSLPLPSISVIGQEYKNLIKGARSDLDKMIAAEKANGLHAEVLVEEGESNKEIFKIIEDQKIDLVILRAHVEGHLEHFLFGRSNEEIIRKMPCSIMLLKDEPKPMAW